MQNFASKKSTWKSSVTCDKNKQIHTKENFNVVFFLYKILKTNKILLKNYKELKAEVTYQIHNTFRLLSKLLTIQFDHLS